MMPNNRSCLRIGVTGGVGSGKSEVLLYLEAAYDAVVLRTDDLAKELMEPGGMCYEEVKALFGEDVLTKEGIFDRALIASRVFADPVLLEKLNGITHPAVWRLARDRMCSARERGAGLICLESALLLDAEGNQIGNDLYDELWYIYADEAVRRERLKASRPYSDEKITSIIASQMPEEIFRAGCDRIIENSGDFAKTVRQIDGILKGGPVKTAAEKKQDDTLPEEH